MKLFLKQIGITTFLFLIFIFNTFIVIAGDKSDDFVHVGIAYTPSIVVPGEHTHVIQAFVGQEYKDLICSIAKAFCSENISIKVRGVEFVREDNYKLTQEDLNSFHDKLVTITDNDKK